MAGKVMTVAANRGGGGGGGLHFGKVPGPVCKGTVVLWF